MAHAKRAHRRNVFGSAILESDFVRASWRSPLAPIVLRGTGMILCGTDFSVASQAAVSAAAALARKRDAELLLVTVLEHEGVVVRPSNA
jgi:Universal stress protein family